MRGIGGGLALPTIVQRIYVDHTGFTAAQRKADAFSKGIGVSLNRVGKDITKYVTLPVLGIGVVATKMALDVEKGLREVNTLFGLTGQAAEDSFQSMRSQVADLSSEIGVAQTTLVKGLYDAISSGVPRENAFEFLKVAAKAAVAGVTTTQVAVQGLTTTINGFGLTFADAERVADSMFQVVNDGVVRFEDLASAVGIVAPIAHSAGVSLEEVNAALAAITLGGAKTSEAATQVRSSIVGLITPGEELSAIYAKHGYASGQAAIAALGYQGALKLVHDAVDGDAGAIQKLLGRIEGVNATLKVAGAGSETYAQKLDNQTNATGVATRAFDEMEKSAARAWERTIVQLQNAAIVIGNELLPVLSFLLGLVVRVVDAWSSLPGPVRAAVGVLLVLTAILGPLLVVGTKLIGVWVNVARGVSQFVLSARVGAATTTSLNSKLGALVGGKGMGGLLGVAAALTVATIAWQLHRAEQQRNEQSIKDLASAFAEAGNRMDGTRLHLARLMESDADFGRFMGDLNVDISDLSDALSGSEEGFQAYIRGLKDSGKANDIQIAALQKARTHVIEANRRVNALKLAEEDLGTTVAGVTPEIEAEAEAVEVLGEESRTTAGLVIDLAQASRSFEGSQRNLEDAHRRVAEAQERLNSVEVEAADVKREVTAEVDAYEESLQAELDRLDAIVTEREAHIKALKAEAEARDEQDADERDALVASLDAELDALKAIVAERREHVETLKDAIPTREAEREELETFVATLDDERKALRGVTDEISRQTSAVDALLDAKHRDTDVSLGLLGAVTGRRDAEARLAAARAAVRAVTKDGEGLAAAHEELRKAQLAALDATQDLERAQSRAIATFRAKGRSVAQVVAQIEDLSTQAGLNATETASLVTEIRDAIDAAEDHSAAVLDDVDAMRAQEEANARAVDDFEETQNARRAMAEAQVRSAEMEVRAAEAAVSRQQALNDQLLADHDDRVEQRKRQTKAEIDEAERSLEAARLGVETQRTLNAEAVDNFRARVEALAEQEEAARDQQRASETAARNRAAAERDMESALRDVENAEFDLIVAHDSFRTKQDEFVKELREKGITSVDDAYAAWEAWARQIGLSEDIIAREGPLIRAHLEAALPLLPFENVGAAMTQVINQLVGGTNPGDSMWHAIGAVTARTAELRSEIERPFDLSALGSAVAATAAAVGGPSGGPTGGPSRIGGDWPGDPGQHPYQAITGLLDRRNVPYGITSGYRPWSRGSYHADGLAVDVVPGIGGSWPRIWNALLPYARAGRLAELLGPQGSWFHGVNAGYVDPDHTGTNAHIHAALRSYASGGIVTAPHVGLVGEGGPELNLPLNPRGAAFLAAALDRMGGFALPPGSAIDKSVAGGPPRAEVTTVNLADAVRITIAGNVDRDTIPLMRRVVREELGELVKGMAKARERG